MKSFVDFPEMFIRDVGIDLRGGDICVAEEGLDAAQVCAILQKVGSKGMADDVHAIIHI